ncbi:MAG: DNA mismatch repair endonuclease MutL [Bacteroidia bacterium]|nr:DNA mismatch repair endonuclease MutL [Bacteroidia bacterium]
MMDRIKLLPDNIANQIAAGEVVQRPASAVKELLENSLDAGATEIRLIVKEGGTQLIQITDNGLGMSPTDARMCWERHATSKITKTDDLFKLSSFGFRGEALASIAAIAHVEMKTKRSSDEIGTLIKIEGSKIIEQDQTACLDGTQFSIKNLFYNVPARRNFLKSIPVELRHIIDEFIRVAMPHHEVAFSMFHNDKEVFDLKPSSPSKRIAELLGKRNDADFLPVSESHDLLNVKGYVGKPEIAKKTRGEQFLFVNNRFIKDAYLHHAIVNSFDQLIAKDQFPSYVLFLELDPSRIDVNIHPTKTEIKFDDERAIYTLVKSAVKKALGQYVVIPELDFGDPNTFNPVAFLKHEDEPNSLGKPAVKVNQFDPFKSGSNMRGVQTSQWHKLFENNYLESRENTQPIQQLIPNNLKNAQITDAFQIAEGFIVANKDNKLIVVDQRAAHERILYEKHLNSIQRRSALTQQLLFPRTIELSGPDYAMAHEILEEMKELGFDVADFGTNCLIINGVPAETMKGTEKDLLEGLLEHYKNNASQYAHDKRKNLAVSLAQNEAIFRTRSMEKEELIDLLEQLFDCELPATRPNGNAVYIELNTNYLSERFK